MIIAASLIVLRKIRGAAIFAPYRYWRARHDLRRRLGL